MHGSPSFGADGIDFRRKPPTGLLRKYASFVAADPPFRSWCRLKQSIYRHHRGWTCGERVDRRGARIYRRLLGNCLTPTDADAGKNFLNRTIHELALKRMDKREKHDAIDPNRLCQNLLTSQTLCFNLFLPQHDNPEMATAIWQALLPGRVAEVVDVKLEHSPGRRNQPLGLGDNSAFDAFVKYRRPDGTLGIIGIETKYTDSFSAPAGEPTAKMHTLAPRLFEPQTWEAAQAMKSQQLWRTHLLAESMKSQDVVDAAYLVLHADGDEECTRLLPDYRRLLREEVCAAEGFMTMTLEHFCTVAAAHVSGAALEWLESFRCRYLDWSPVARELRVHRG